MDIEFSAPHSHDDGGSHACEGLDIDAYKLSGAVKYRESDRRSYSLSYSRLEFSDGNERNQGLLGYEQGLYVRNNWITRLFIDLYASSNSLDNAQYFNPDSDLSLYVTHMTGHTIMSMYGKSFMHRLYLSAGMYSQADFSAIRREFNGI